MADKRPKKRGEPRPLSLGPWPLGIDNVHLANHTVFQVPGPDQPPARLRTATNVVLDDEGWPRVRGQAAVSESLTAGEGLLKVGGQVFKQDDGTLYAGAVELVTGLARRASIEFHGGRWYITDGTTHKWWDGTTVRPWGAPVPTLTVSATTGGTEIPAGTYLVQASFTDAYGNEHGCSQKYAVTLSAAGRILVDVGAETADTPYVNLYVGIENQPTTSFVSKTATSAFPVTLTDVHNTEGDPPITIGMVGPWSGIAGVASWRGRLLTWASNVVQISEANQDCYLFDTRWFMTFRKAVTGVVGFSGAGAGIWVATSGGLVWVNGEEVDTLLPNYITHDPVFAGALLVDGEKIPALQTSARVALFVSTEGLLAALPDGSVRNLTRKRYEFSTLTRVSIALAESDDLTQILIAGIE